VKVWVYSGQHDLEIEVTVFAEDAREEAKEYAARQKRFFKQRLVYTLSLMEVVEARNPSLHEEQPLPTLDQAGPDSRVSEGDIRNEF